ncbi:ammonium transporter AmtB-like domain-containing protein [Microdochium trichocladiopsis]|uniref:Ammonium transporter AmtB-like domain-containing protein n=1 Tax=Microdochium trichocladiopsis TaxID=1682393 RepID=A0A9P9BKB6_9PEZI|nr:ammonium transporter AmtB-like domain-containing protein [Microdochium trichocladiopsis]KAH7026469.1 ammonium transporter AmtB-like domain-containing protein [Microdochium trichocladiopsis]
MSDEILPVLEWPAYEVNPNGGDPITQDLNAPYDKGDLCWLLVSTVICWQITPAIGFLYAGMHRRKAALTMVFQSLFCACACGIQFWVYGYSLYMSHTESAVWGDLSLAGLHNVMAFPSQANTGIPDILYAAFGMTFVTATAMILAGAMLERGRLFPSMVFLLCWTTFVYYVLAYWEWNPSGWLYQLGVYDFAGSGPVHIASGFGALAWSLMLGPRVRSDSVFDSTKHDPATSTAEAQPATASSSGSTNGQDPSAREKTAATATTPTAAAEAAAAATEVRKHENRHHTRPHNPFLVGLGTVLIWFGWFAFNGASTANLSIRSIYVVVNTNLAACGGGLAWAGLEYLHEHFDFRRHSHGSNKKTDDSVELGPVTTAALGGGGKFSIVGFCSGIIAGLVGITPAAGFVPVYVASLIGAVTATASFYVVRHKHRLVLFGHVLDDGLDIFAIHGVGGVVGDILTGFFAATFVPALDGASGATYAGGWWEGNYIQMGYQLAAALTCASWSFVVSCALLFVINKIPGLHLRATEEEEIRGLDFKYLSDSLGGDWDSEMGEDGGHVRRYVLQAYEGVPVPVAAVAGPAAAPGLGGVKADGGEVVKQD